MQTNNNDFIPEATIQSEHERGSNKGLLMLFAGIVLGGIIVGGAVAVWSLFEGDLGAMSMEEEDKREIKAAILDDFADEYGALLDGSPVGLDTSNLHVVSTPDDGVYEILAILSLDDPSIATGIEDSVRSGDLPAGTQSEDIAVVFIRMEVSKSGEDWQIDDMNAYMGTSLWFLNHTAAQAAAQARESTKDLSVRSDLRSIMIKAEIYYDDHNNSYEGLEDDRDIVRILDEASEDSPGIARCDASGDAYRCYAELAEESSRGGSLYYCVDSEESLGEITRNPANTPGYECQ